MIPGTDLAEQRYFGGTRNGLVHGEGGAITSGSSLSKRKNLSRF